MENFMTANIAKKCSSFLEDIENMSMHVWFSYDNHNY